MVHLYTLARHSLAGLRVLVAMTLLLGVAYPLAVTGIAQVALPWRADGSLVTASGGHTTDAGRAAEAFWSDAPLAERRRGDHPGRRRPGAFPRPAIRGGVER